MNLYVVRHGQTDWNVENRVQGKADIELNETGKLQANQTAKLLSDTKIDLIISSPLKRAVQTANIICLNRDIPITCDERISERDFGEFEGKIKEIFDFDIFWDYNDSNIYLKAENIRDFFKRVYIFLDDIKLKYPDKNILVVTHGGVSLPINCYFNGIPEDGKLKHLGLKNCEVKKYSL